MYWSIGQYPGEHAPCRKPPTFMVGMLSLSCNPFASRDTEFVTVAPYTPHRAVGPCREGCKPSRTAVHGTTGGWLGLGSIRAEVAKRWSIRIIVFDVRLPISETLVYSEDLAELPSLRFARRPSIVVAARPHFYRHLAIQRRTQVIGPEIHDDCFATYRAGRREIYAGSMCSIAAYSKCREPLKPQWRHSTRDTWTRPKPLN